MQWQRNGARMYDPVLGRFLGVEPLADKYVSLSVYAYAANDPVNLADPSGLDPDRPGPNEDFASWWLDQFDLGKAAERRWLQQFDNPFTGGGGKWYHVFQDVTISYTRYDVDGTEENGQFIEYRRYNPRDITETFSIYLGSYYRPATGRMGSLNNMEAKGLMLAQGPGGELSYVPTKFSSCVG